MATESFKCDESLSRQEIVQSRPVQVGLLHESRQIIVLANIIIDFFEDNSLSSNPVVIEMVMVADLKLEISAPNPFQMNRSVVKSIKARFKILPNKS